MVRCASCKEQIDDKFKFAILQNTCPICGQDLFNETEFNFRSRVAKALQKNGIMNADLIYGVVNDVCSSSETSEFVKEKIAYRSNCKPEPKISSPSIAPQARIMENPKEAVADIPELNMNPEDFPEQKDFFDDVVPSDGAGARESEEERVVREMVENGEIAITNAVIPATRKIPPSNRPVPKPINRI